MLKHNLRTLLRGGLPTAHCCGVVSRPPHPSNKEVRDVQISAIDGRAWAGRETAHNCSHRDFGFLPFCVKVNLEQPNAIQEA